MATLTIAEIAQRVGLPGSTVRYYRDHFKDYIPVVGEGRQRRYPAEAVEVFQVTDTLNRLFPRNVVKTAEPLQTTAEQHVGANRFCHHFD